MHRNNASPLIAIGRFLTVVFAGLAFLVSTGCASAPEKDRTSARASQKGKVSKVGEKITMEELDQLTYGFADRYMASLLSKIAETALVHS